MEAQDSSRFAQTQNVAAVQPLRTGHTPETMTSEILHLGAVMPSALKLEIMRRYNSHQALLEAVKVVVSAHHASNGELHRLGLKLNKMPLYVSQCRTAIQQALPVSDAQQSPTHV